MRMNLSGELLSDEWAEVYRYFGYVTGFYCPGDLRAALEGLADGEELVLEINSVGGDVFAANEIYAMLQSSAHPVRAEIQSLAASAASYFVLACDRVDMALPAQMMIHCAAWEIGGNKTDHRWAADQLEVTDASILDVYCRKCGEKAERTQLQALMEAETYLTARQCLDLGLVDGILGEEAEDGDVRLVASAANNLIRAMRTRPDIQTLLDRRADEEWRQRAALELEQNRYHRA